MITNYEKVRDARRRRIVELKKARRVTVGSYLTFVFESAVHFVRFAIPPDARARFATGEVALVVAHPNERARAVLSDVTKTSLLGDLA